MTIASNILVVASDLETQQGVAVALGRCGWAPILACSVDEAIGIVNRFPVSLAFCSDELQQAAVDKFIKHASQPLNKIPVVVVSRLDDWKRYVEYLGAGAFAYVLHSPNGEEIERLARAVLSASNAQSSSAN